MSISQAEKILITGPHQLRKELRASAVHLNFAMRFKLLEGLLWWELGKIFVKNAKLQTISEQFNYLTHRHDMACGWASLTVLSYLSRISRKPSSASVIRHTPTHSSNPSQNGIPVDNVHATRMKNDSCLISDLGSLHAACNRQHSFIRDKLKIQRKTKFED